LKYQISRNGELYGPYSLADLLGDVSSGNILLTDLAHSEGMEDWVPVSQIIGNIPPPIEVIKPAAAPQYASTDYPDPPDLHWKLVLLLTVFTCSLFLIIWDFVLAAWMKKVEPASKAIYWYLASIGVAILTGAVVFGVVLTFGYSRYWIVTGFLVLGRLAGFVLAVVARFSMKGSLEEHYNTAEPMNLSLNGVMTFFFGSLYFQYHLNRIVSIKQLNRNTVLAG
jgi:uncharacterized protein DUF4339